MHLDIDCKISTRKPALIPQTHQLYGLDLNTLEKLATINLVCRNEDGHSMLYIPDLSMRLVTSLYLICAVFHLMHRLGDQFHTRNHVTNHGQ